jgi:hypothetical protein
LATGSFPHDNFSSVYWIFNKLCHMIPLWKGKNPIYFGVKGQGHHYYKYNFWQQDRFRTITLVLYIGSLPSLATWFSCGRERTLFILGSFPLYRFIIYIDRRILWCTHFLFPDTRVSSTNKTDCHDIDEILLKVALSTITLAQKVIFSRHDIAKKLSCSCVFYWYWLNCWLSLVELLTITGWIVDYHWLNCWLSLVELLTIIGWIVDCHWLNCWLSLVELLTVTGWIVDFQKCVRSRIKQTQNTLKIY